MRNYRTRYFDISVPVFVPAAVITLAFVTLTILFDEQAGELFTSFQSYMSRHFVWLISLCINYYLLFLLILGLSSLGRTRIGGKHAQPDFSRFSWIAMLFSAGMGIGLVYFSVAEPMYHYIHPVRAGAAESTIAADAMKHTFFHYGFHVWGVYILLGIALAYFTFNRNLPLSIRSTLRPLLGPAMDRWPGHVIDVIAVLATLFGLATSLGFGAVQFSSGLGLLTGLSSGVNLQVLSIVGITLIATASVISGLHKGLRYLSNLNIIIALCLFFFVLVIGSTGSLLVGFFGDVGTYLAGLPTMASFTGDYADRESWFTGWSMFYWAWWISWSPFVGTFIARISKGRTIREIAIFGLLLPAFFSFLWMSVLGGTAIEMQLEGTADLAAVVSEDSSLALFSMLDQLPLSQLSSALSILLVATFFITSSDSGSLVVDYMTSGGKLDAPKGQKVFWAFMEGAIAIALLVGGGLSALQSASISTGFPFSVILVFVSLSLWKSLREDEQAK